MLIEDGTDPTAQDEPEAPAIETDEIADQTEDGAEGEEVSESEDPDAELEEVERGGKKYKVSKALKAELMMQADYTRKTQEAAEIRKIYETNLNSFRESSAEIISLKGAIAHADQTIAQFDQTDWDKLEQEDPFTANQRWRQYQQWKAHRDKLDSAVDEKTQGLEKQRTEEFAKRAEETRRVAQSEIKGWTPEQDVKLAQFVRGLGLDQTEIEALISPKTYKLAYMAMLGSQIVSKVSPAAKPSTTASPAPLLEPTASISRSKAPAKTGLRDDMPTDDWVKLRNAQERKRRQG